jgi:transposase-like protein
MDNQKQKRPALSRKQLAAKYGVTTETLRRWIIRAKIEIPKNQLLTPAAQNQIFEVLGEP